MKAERGGAIPDWLTVACIAVVTHVFSVSIHEAVGHGGACIAVGCTPQLLTTMQFQGDEQSLTRVAVDAISAGGSVANLMEAAGFGGGRLVFPLAVCHGQSACGSRIPFIFRVGQCRGLGEHRARP
jgi:hypothetical protein